VRFGVGGYILKHENYYNIQDAINEVLEYKRSPLNPTIARKTLEYLSRIKSEHNDKEVDLIQHLLTDREKEVLLHLVNGYDAKRIADIMTINTLTVRKHISNIYSKLHVNSKAQVISLALKNKWF
jgi:DNA-binding NarL/FixJ family response regulator